jgi:hypothetical protein
MNCVCKSGPAARHGRLRCPCPRLQLAVGCRAETRRSEVFPGQQPEGDAGETPGVAAAPVALAGAIVPGIAKLIVMLSAQAGVFGVGTTAICGSMLVPTN